ncbi:dual specificity protein phosphatase family protein [Halosimplex rubrum]|uniref:Dual specificity protein phosphatase family protein n=1 Tax=Halosimplex rubrum TaxID=869889 RepID=A0A7D5T7M3_9EURY|nr:dual specificity protein phosphatase family protein [Halosimplex rubrum]QLH79209.1 dual specificity protein phosphatase family protein [Halosimplex rubrum]
MPDVHNRESGADAHRLAPAAPDEECVYGACSPGWHSAADRSHALADWIAVARANDIERVCSLLPGDQSPGDLETDGYTDVFGQDNVLHAPIPDGRLACPALLKREVLPFLDDAVEADERVVVHCLDGMGRTGQVLAAWLAHDRDYEPEEAIETVEETGRQPREPVREGNASEQELRDLLTVVR